MDAPLESGTVGQCLSDPPPQNVGMEIQPPEKFLALCEHYHLKPERLTLALQYSFCLAPPHELILIQRAAAPLKSTVPDEA